MINKKQIRLAYWNAQGVTNKKEELRQFIKEHNIDIMHLSETTPNIEGGKLHNESHRSENQKRKEYSSHHQKQHHPLAPTTNRYNQH